MAIYKVLFIAGLIKRLINYNLIKIKFYSKMYRMKFKLWLKCRVHF